MSESQVLSWDLHELEDYIQAVDSCHDAFSVLGPVLVGHTKRNVVSRSEARVDDYQGHDKRVPNCDKTIVRLEQKVRLARLFSATLLLL